MRLTISGGGKEGPVLGSMTQQFFVESKFNINEISCPPFSDDGALATTMYSFVRTEWGTDVIAAGVIYSVSIREDYSVFCRVGKYRQYVCVIRRVTIDYVQMNPFVAAYCVYPMARASACSKGIKCIV